MEEKTRIGVTGEHQAVKAAGTLRNAERSEGKMQLSGLKRAGWCVERSKAHLSLRGMEGLVEMDSRGGELKIWAGGQTG